MTRRRKIVEPDELPDNTVPYMDTPRSIAAHKGRTIVRMQKDIAGLNERASYTVTTAIGVGVKAKVVRKANLDWKAARDRFIERYRALIV